jgi:hypothetical protein
VYIHTCVHTFTGCICRAGKNNLWLYFWANEIVVPRVFQIFNFPLTFILSRSTAHRDTTLKTSITATNESIACYYGT